jgi:hypothetical protein
MHQSRRGLRLVHDAKVAEHAWHVRRFRAVFPIHLEPFGFQDALVYNAALQWLAGARLAHHDFAVPCVHGSFSFGLAGWARELQSWPVDGRWQILGLTCAHLVVSHARLGAVWTEPVALGD